MKNEQKTITNANEVRQSKPNVPTLRFAEFAEQWEQKTFDETFSILSNNTLSRAELNYENGNYKNIHYGDVLIKFSAFIDVSSPEVPYINDENSSSKLDNILLQDGDIIIADTAEDFTVGKATEVENIDEIKVVSGLHTIPCRPKIKFSPRYLGYYVNSPAYHNQLIPFIQGVKVSSISKTLIKKTFVSFPSLSEQTKIADFLSCLDKKIETQNKISSKYETLIKGIIDCLLNKKEDNYYTFKDLYLKAGEGGTPTTDNDSHYENGTIPFIKIDDLSQKYIKRNSDYITYLGLEKSAAWLIPSNSVIFSNGATIGRISINTYPIATKQGVLGIVPSPIVMTEYLYYYMKTTYFRGQVRRITVKGTMDCAYLKDLNSIICHIPEINHQEKRIALLTVLDKNIACEKMILQKLKEQKKYLLSKMFI